MTINPRDYDLDELREIARKRGGPEAANADVDPAEIGLDALAEEGTETPSAGDSFRAGLYRELLPIVGAADDIEKPYLRRIPDTYAAEFVVFEWLEFLLMHAGYAGAADAMDYYESVEWITDDVESTLNDYLLGIDEGTGSDGSDLDVDDHLLSLVYVAKLASMQ